MTTFSRGDRSFATKSLGHSSSLSVRVRGRVQGVGFRPHVARLARAHSLAGDVRNDAEGVLARVSGTPHAIELFLRRLEAEAPPLARIDRVEVTPLEERFASGFVIAESESGDVRTEIAPDAAVCAECTREVLSPSSRRHRYPFAACTHCGPRLSVVRSIPYDRAGTTMREFPLCAACVAEYGDASDRRFHAEATACPACGPRVSLVDRDGRAIASGGSEPDALAAAQRLVLAGEILALKGLGGFHLACDATNEAAVARLRERKAREAKPFAIMARDLSSVRRLAFVSPAEEHLLSSPEGPIVLLARRASSSLAESVAPGLGVIGAMLPTTPLHLLLLEGLDRPLVMTSGNVAGAPPVIDDEDAKTTLAPIADALLLHDRRIQNRVDDSIARVVLGRARVLRRSRGHAPAAISLPAGFEAAPPLLAYGAELKSTFCLLSEGRAILSQHLGDLEDRRTLEELASNLSLYSSLHAHTPLALAADLHPDSPSARLAEERARREALPLHRVQHHHAHFAACLAENEWPFDGASVLGIVLDGFGYGDDGGAWGGEVLLGDYAEATRVGSLRAVPLFGGDRASHEPWRNLYAQLATCLGWDEARSSYGSLDLTRRLADKPLATLDRMRERHVRAPLSSSCGRLFDAVAAASGIAFERQRYEGEAAMLLESTIDDSALSAAHSDPYPFAITRASEGVRYQLDPTPMWRALLTDLAHGASSSLVSARFHVGLAEASTELAKRLRDDHPAVGAVALSGGCFQNRVLLEETSTRLERAEFRVLEHASVPPNDGGISLGQAVVAAARILRASSSRDR